MHRAVHGALLNLIPTGAYYAAYASLCCRALAGALTVGDLTLIVGSVFPRPQHHGNLVSGLVGVSEQALFIKDLFDFFETNPLISSPPDALPAPRPIRDGFEFQNVSFAYPSSDRNVLSDVSFRFDPGERIALVGENGAGKTTLVKLLARLYDPTEGRILLDGVDLREYRSRSLRHEIGVIFQDYMRYDMLVSENIGVWQDRGACRMKSRVTARRRRAWRPAWSRKLPEAYRQMLGRRFEGGVDLSTGQWQKIALGPRLHARCADPDSR